MSEWIEWKGGRAPESRNTYVEVKFWCGVVVEGIVREFSWRHTKDSSDIVAYRVCKEKKS